MTMIICFLKMELFFQRLSIEIHRLTGRRKQLLTTKLLAFENFKNHINFGTCEGDEDFLMNIIKFNPVHTFNDSIITEWLEKRKTELKIKFDIDIGMSYFLE